LVLLRNQNTINDILPFVVLQKLKYLKAIKFGLVVRDLNSILEVLGSILNSIANKKTKAFIK
jgi:hypothetical protein